MQSLELDKPNSKQGLTTYRPLEKLKIKIKKIRKGLLNYLETNEYTL